MAQDRAHRVHLRVARGAISTRGVHFLENCRRRTQIEATAPVFLGDQCRQVARLGERRDKLGWISPFTIKATPIFAGKLRTKRAYAFSNVGKLILSCGALFHVATLCSRRRLTSLPRSGPN